MTKIASVVTAAAILFGGGLAVGQRAGDRM
jgi:hypothetical protein